MINKVVQLGTKITEFINSGGYLVIGSYMIAGQNTTGNYPSSMGLDPTTIRGNRRDVSGVSLGFRGEVWMWMCLELKVGVEVEIANLTCATCLPFDQKL